MCVYINYSNSDITAVCYFPINIIKYTFFYDTMRIMSPITVKCIFYNKMLHFMKTYLVSCIIRYSTTSLLRYYNV